MDIRNENANTDRTVKVNQIVDYFDAKYEKTGIKVGTAIDETTGEVTGELSVSNVENVNSNNVYFVIGHKMQGYENALEVKKAYNAAVTELEGVRKLQSEWDQKGIPEKKYWVIKANVPEQTKQKSLHERMEEKKRGMEQQKKKERKRNQDRDCL